MGAAINQVLETFSVDQLRDLAFAMSSRGVADSQGSYGSRCTA